MINFRLASRLKPFCLLLAAWLLSLSARAQCGTQHNVNAYYSGLTHVQCNGTNYLLDGYVLASGYFTPPFTNAAISSANGGTPSVSISGDTLFFQDVMLNSSSFPTINSSITFLDSCNNADTLQMSLYVYGSNLQMIGGQGNYSLCDSSFRVRTYAGGLNSFVFTTYNTTTFVYDTLTPASVSISADSLVVTGLPPGSYNVYYKDSCGNTHNSYLSAYLSNYNYYLTGGRYICDSNGLYTTLTPRLSGPFSYLGYTGAGSAPLVQINGDSILIGQATPYSSYTFSFLDGCNDTFTVQYYAYDSAQSAFYPVLAQRGCSTYSLYIKTTGGPFYDVQIESGLGAPGMGYTYYPDSLVITGLPVDSMYNQFVLSFRDSSCHNRRSVTYSLSWEGLSTGEYTYWQQPPASCGSGICLSARLAGVPPYTNLTWIKKPNTPAVTFSGDTLRLCGLLSLLNEQADTLYSFSLQDSCGKVDTFQVSSGYLYTNMTGNEVYSSGGCSGANNGSAWIRFNDPWDPANVSTPYSNLTVAGPAGATAMISGDTVKLGNLVPDSSYAIRFQDSCGRLYQYRYTVPASNIPMVLTVTPSAEGSCTNTLDSNYALNVAVTNPNYPYTAYLSGPVADTITGITTDHFMFSQLPEGTYQIKVEDFCNNIQTLNYTLVSAGTLITTNYAYFYRFKGCDSFVYMYNRYQYATSPTNGFVNNLKFHGPYAAFVVRGVDTFWSYNSNTDDTTNISIPFTFPALSQVNSLETMYVIDGCGDTVAVQVQPLYLYYGNSAICDSGLLSNRYLVSFNQGYNFNFPIRLTYTGGNLQDTSAIVFNSASQVDTLNFSSGQSACYQIKDTCGRILGNVCFNGPPPFIAHYVTRFCPPVTDGPHKGNVSPYLFYPGPDSVLYHMISGPGVIPDTTVMGGGLVYANVDTGTYVMSVREVNSCGRIDTFTMRVEPYLDSLSVTFVPGCLNANKLVVRLYSNKYSGDYKTLTQGFGSLWMTTSGGNYYSFSSGDTVYNLPSNTDFYLHAGDCRVDTIHSPVYNNPVITASAGFFCSNGYSIAILGEQGVTPYTYQILSGNPVSYSAPVQASNVFTGLPGVSGNTYQVRIADQCGNAFTTLVHADSVVNPLIETGMACVGNSYSAQVDSIPQVSYTWVSPNGTTYSGPSLSFNPITAADTGTYRLYITNTVTNCTVDTIHQVSVTTCVPLPIDAIDLNARWQNGQALVYWTEPGNQAVSFQVQRSDDGYSFTTLSSGSKAFYNQGQEYRYTDNQPLDRNFYRIKAQTQDGRQWVSEVVLLSRNGGQGMTATITSNGTGSGNRLLLDHCPSEAVDIAIYNMQGALVQHGTAGAGKGQSLVHELPAGLAPGLYMIKVQAGTQVISLKWNVLE